MMKNKSLGFIGGGRVTKILLQGFKNRNVRFRKIMVTDTSLDALAKLPTIYGSPTVTAGNAPPMSAGATANLIMTREEAEKRGLTPLGTIKTNVCIATIAREMATAPAIAIKKALDKTGLKLEDMKLIEINEAFAAVVLVSTKILANNDENKWQEIKEKTNVNGGALAIGHPVGASAGRITMTALYELKRRGGGYAVAAICGGLGQSEAVIIEV